MKKNCIWIFLVLIAMRGFVFAQDNITNAYGSGGGAITTFDRLSKTKTGGYFDTEWLASDSSNTFKAHRLIIQMSNQIHNNILFNSEIEFEYGGQVNAGDDLGEIKIEQAWVDYRFSDALKFRTGIILVPFGYINIYHDSDVRDTTNRPIYAKYIVPSTWMDTGIGVNGTFEGVNGWMFNYEAYIFNGLKEGISGSKGIRDARPNFKLDNNKNKAIAGRLGISPMVSLDIGASIYNGKYDTSDNNNLFMGGLDFFWRNNDIEFLGEWARIAIENNAATIPSRMYGYYIEVRYHALKEIMKANFANGFDDPTLTLFARYSHVDLDESATDKYDITQTTFGLNYRPIERAVFKLEYEFNREGANETSNNAIVGSVAIGF